MAKEKLCERTNENKYLTRKSPPMSATACPLGMVEIGNDGQQWQVVLSGKSQKWALCGRANTNCINTSIKKTEVPSKTKILKKCPSGKVLNPVTGRCIKDKSSGVTKGVNTKKCPSGKVLNPVTGRCIKDKSSGVTKGVNTKKCPSGKVLNPVTGRCIKDKSSGVTKNVNTKKCPSGKVLNPVTGRCIKDKSVSVKLPIKSKTPAKSVSLAKKSRYFELVEGTSFKFWNIEKVSGGVKTSFGKIGSIPRELYMYSDSTQEINEYISKKISEKVRKGYVEIMNDSNKTNASLKPKIMKKSVKKEPSNLNIVSSKSKKDISSKKVSCDNFNWKPVWDIKKNGVMLAHTYKDPKSGKIKNPPKGYPQAPNGWFLSEKFDGYRCIWDGNKFYSRNGNEFVTPEWFKAFMPAGIALDGELFMGRENFQKMGIARRKVPDNEEWIKSNIKYLIFDSPTHPGMFEDRLKFIKKVISDRSKCDKKKLGIPAGVKCPLIMADQIQVKTEEDVQKHFKTLTSQGAEGVMLRAPNSPYESKRSSLLLKVKQLFDDECKIIGYKSGTGKYKDMLGAFECQLIKNKAIKFTISGMDDSIRQNYKKTHPIGTIVTFTYMGTSNSGVPRHPNYLRIRKGKY